jgi:hypothetical protein
MSAKAPFFIVGCVRSGTTMLRNILRRHPDLACPEETHFYRWSEPFRGPVYRQVASNNPTLKHHRKLDGITDDEFKAMLDGAPSRAELYAAYMARYIEVKKPGAKRWFDKTPQNAYGASMIAMEIPAARFVHIVRDPVNVVASLRIGKVMKIEDLVAACSYWNEAVANLAVLKRAFPQRVLNLQYEAFTKDPLAGVQEVLKFIGAPYDPAAFADVKTAEVNHEASGVLSEAEIARVHQLCLSGRIRHGYVPAEDVQAFREARRSVREQRRAAKKGRPAADADETAATPSVEAE